MLNKYERYAQFHYLDIDRSPDYAPVIPIKTIYRLLRPLVRANEAYNLYQHETNELRIDKCGLMRARTGDDPLPEAIGLLVRFTDTDVGNPAYSELEDPVVEVKTLGDRQGVSVSAHVLICTDPVDGNADQGRRHVAVIEEVPGLGRNNIQRILKHIFKKTMGRRLLMPNPEDARKDIVYKPEANMGLKINEDEDSFGGITGFTLRSPIQNPATIDEAIVSQMEVVHKTYRVLELPDSPADAVNSIRQMMRRERADHVSIRYKNKFGNQQTAIMGTTREDIEDMLLAKKEKITSVTALPQCATRLNRVMLDKMRKFGRDILE